MIANYHTHTRWCNHATGEIEDYLDAAIDAGLYEIAITEHVPHKDNRDPKRIQWEDFHKYNDALDGAIERYKGKIKVIKGFECEYYPEAMGAYEIFREKYGYEIMILGQHRSGDDREIDNFGKKDAAKMMRYADEICTGLKTGMFDFLAHPDLVLENYNDNKWDENCEKVMGRIFKACEDYSIPVEINANGIRGSKRYPDDNAFMLSKEYGLTYLVNSDAHHPEHLCDDMVKRAEEMADSLGITVSNKFDFRRKR